MKLDAGQKMKIIESLLGLGERIPGLIEWLTGNKSEGFFGTMKKGNGR